MAVQQTRKSRSRRGKRRAHDFLTLPSIGVDVESGENHLRHHVTANGFYRGKQVLVSKARRVADDTDEVTAGA